MNNENEIKPLVAELLFWRKKAHETPEMLLSSHHAKSDECAEIMRQYELCFRKLEEVIIQPSEEQHAKKSEYEQMDED